MSETKSALNLAITPASPSEPVDRTEVMAVMRWSVRLVSTRAQLSPPAGASAQARALAQIVQTLSAGTSQAWPLSAQPSVPEEARSKESLAPLPAGLQVGLDGLEAGGRDELGPAPKSSSVGRLAAAPPGAYGPT